MNANSRAGPESIDRRAIPPKARESQWLAADDWPIRRIDWAPHPDVERGSLLFLSGRGDFYEKYLETLQHWHDRGWRVTAIDWRGQAGSGRLGNDGLTGHIGDFATWVADLAQFWADWKAATPGPHVVVAHSMGGHLALRTLAENRIDPVAVALCAPMLGLLGRFPPGILRWVARLMVRIGDPRRPAWKWNETPGRVADDRIALLTHDADRYADELWWRAHRPELAMGPGSWGWIAAASASMRKLFRPGLLESVKTPVLIVAASRDRLVAIGPIDRAAECLPDAELLRFGPEARHEILREADPVRDRALGAIDAFVERAGRD